jgi:hypothetical protein
MDLLVSMINSLEAYADMDNCNGSCDMFSPYHKCVSCYSRDVLNEIMEDASKALDKIRKNKNFSKPRNEAL